MKIMISLLIGAMILLFSTMAFAVSLTSDDQAGTPSTLFYEMTLNGVPSTMPAVAGVNPSLARLLVDMAGKVNMGVANTVFVKSIDAFGVPSDPSPTLTFTPRLPLVPIQPTMGLLNGKRGLFTGATTIDSDNINGALYYIVTINGKVKTVPATVVDPTHQHCECDISSMIVAGDNTGTIVGKNPWGLSAACPLSLNVVSPTVPTGIRLVAGQD